MSELICVTYDDGATAPRALEALRHEFQAGRLVHLQGAASIRRSAASGTVRVTDVLASGDQGRLVPHRAFWGLMAGIVYFTPRLWGLIEALLRGLGHPASDLSLTEDFAAGARDALSPGGSAVMILAMGDAGDEELEALTDLGGQVARAAFTHEDVGAVVESLEIPWVLGIATSALDPREV